MSEYAVPLEILHVTDALPPVVFDCDDASTRPNTNHALGWMRAAIASLGGRVHYEDSTSLRFRAGSYPNGEPLILYFRRKRSDGGDFALSDRAGIPEWVRWNIAPSAVARINTIARRVGLRVSSGCILLDTTIEAARENASRFEALVAKLIEELHATKPPEAGKCEHGHRLHTHTRWGYKCLDCASQRAAELAASSIGVEYNKCEHGVDKKIATRYAWNCEACKRISHKLRNDLTRPHHFCDHGVPMRSDAKFARYCEECQRARKIAERGRRRH